MKEEFEFPMITASKKSLAKRKLIHGIGINDAWYITQPLVEGKNYRCPYYIRWKCMLKRSYSEKDMESSPTYNGVSVCKEWHVFSTFRQWMAQQDWEGKQLDKDIILPDNKVYSPETCVFVSRNINNLLLDSGKSRGKYKQGVYLDHGKFRASCWNGAGKNKHLGYFQNPDAEIILC